MSHRITILFATTLAACAPSASATDDDSSTTGPVVQGDPDAPGQGCSDTFDPSRIYVVLNRAGSYADVHYLLDVRDPSRECAFNIVDPGEVDRGMTFGVRPSDGQMLVTKTTLDRHNLIEAYPDALERKNGVWTLVGATRDEGVYLFGKDGCWDYLRNDAPILMAYPPSGELGYWCAGEGFYRFDDTLVVEVRSETPPALFLADGRMLVVAQLPNSPIRRVAKVTTDDDPVITPLEYDEDLDVAEIRHASHVDGVPYLIVSSNEPRSVYHVEGETLVFDYVLPDAFPEQNDPEIDQYAIDGQGVIAFGSYYPKTQPQTEQTFVARLDPSGAEILYTAPTDRSPLTLMDLPESSGEIGIVRLAVPL